MISLRRLNGSCVRRWGRKAYVPFDIPIAFVVDGKGLVAWIGEPQALDEPLAAVVEGRFDLARESAAYRQRMESAPLYGPVLVSSALRAATIPAAE